MTSFDFTLPANSNKSINISDFKNEKNVVLYFYPKDNTPGCTIEANDFNNKLKQFAEFDTVVIGVSADSVASHDKFIAKYDLKFDLISDSDKELCNKLGVWIEKSMYGKKYMGIDRSTFLLNKQLEIVKEWRKVSVKNHVDEVLEEVKKL
jgi:peroxiredoxin Q/BCP